MDFSTLRSVEMSAPAREKLSRSLSRARKNRTAQRAIGFAIASISSIAALIYSCASVSDSLSTAGVYDSFSFIASDGAAAFAYSRELGLFILESLPAFGIALALAALLASIWSVSRLRSEFKFA